MYVPTIKIFSLNQSLIYLIYENLFIKYYLTTLIKTDMIK